MDVFDYLGGNVRSSHFRPLRDHRNEGIEFGGQTSIPAAGQAERVELMRERWDQGLDIWTGEPSKES